VKTDQEVRDKLQEEIDRLKKEKGHSASLTRGFIMALEWFLQSDI